MVLVHVALLGLQLFCPRAHSSISAEVIVTSQARRGNSFYNTLENVIINTWRACAVRVTVLGLCVCSSAFILALRATRWPKN